MKERRTCPRCGSANIKAVYTGIIKNYAPIYWLVGCYSCGKKTNFYGTKQQSICAWNKGEVK